MCQYQIVTVWWPAGWEPTSPWDVPNCIVPTHSPPDQERLSYERAEAILQALNRQCTDRPGSTWYVIVAEAAEAAAGAPPDAEGDVELSIGDRRLRVIRPERGSRGDCSHCPAREFPCAEASGSAST